MKKLNCAYCKKEINSNEKYLKLTYFDFCFHDDCFYPYFRSERKNIKKDIKGSISRIENGKIIATRMIKISKLTASITLPVDLGCYIWGNDRINKLTPT